MLLKGVYDHPLYPAYTVTYDANGGVNPPTSQGKLHGIDITLSSDRPTRTNYTFWGWSIDSAAITPTYYTNGAFARDEDTTLYAVWLPNAYPSSVTFPNPHPSNYKTINFGSTMTLNAIDGFNWSTSDSIIITVVCNPNNYTEAYITAVGMGHCAITITTKNGLMSSRVFYVQDMSNVQSYTFTDGGEGAVAGYSSHIIPITTTPIAAVSNIAWQSLDTSVATVNSATRQVTAQVANGYAVIVGECVDPWGRNQTLIYRLKIGSGIAPAGPPPASSNVMESFTSPYPVSLNYKTIFLGATQTVNVIDAFNWTTSDSNIITVVRNPNNFTEANITAVGMGVCAIIPCTKNGLMGPRNFYVQDLDNIQSYTFTGGGEGYIANQNGTLIIPVTATNVNGSAAQLNRIAWRSLDTSVATVAQNAVTGQVTVTAQVIRGHAVIVGECLDTWGRSHTLIYRVKIG